MNLRAVLFPAVLALLAAAGANAQRVALSDAIYNGWATDPVWDDGNAEVAEYRGERIVYGEVRPHTYRLITVKEDFNTEYYAKADWPYGQKPILTVIKQNQTATIETPNYPYHYMTSVFFDRSAIGDSVSTSAPAP